MKIKNIYMQTLKIKRRKKKKTIMAEESKDGIIESKVGGLVM